VGTRLGVRAFDVVVVPKRPLLNAPQHHVSPAELVAHACVAPISSDDTTKDDGMDTTAVGVALATAFGWLPFPN
jgi:hypothetical protein